MAPGNRVVLVSSSLGEIDHQSGNQNYLGGLRPFDLFDLQYAPVEGIHLTSDLLATADIDIMRDTHQSLSPAVHSKARQIKQGMMQELLTGRTRLV